MDNGITVNIEGPDGDTNVNDSTCDSGEYNINYDPAAGSGGSGGETRW
jgi:hypothetical protein